MPELPHSLPTCLRVQVCCWNCARLPPQIRTPGIDSALEMINLLVDNAMHEVTRQILQLLLVLSNRCRFLSVSSVDVGMMPLEMRSKLVQRIQRCAQHSLSFRIWRQS